MPLDHTRPPESLLSELREVGRDATALSDILRRGLNFPLPTEFPQEQLLDICRSLTELPEGTAEGCRAPLDYARSRLPAIRREYIRSEEFSLEDGEILLTRGAVLDQKLATLIASVTTALDEYRRLAGELRPDVALEAGVAPAHGAVEEAGVHAQRLDTSFAGAQQTVEETTIPESSRADDLKRQLRDARGLNRMAWAEIRMPRVVVSWLRNILDALNDYPEIIRHGVKLLQVGTDIAEPLVDRWHSFEQNLSKFLFGEWRNTLQTFGRIADMLDDRRRKGPPGQIEPPADLDLDEARRMILEGKALPKSWRPFITELDLSFEAELANLSPLADLTHLQSVNLAETQVSDLSPLASLSNLRRLSVWKSEVTDLSVLAGLSNLQNLDLEDTHVSDISALVGLRNLERLHLGHTNVRNVSALAEMNRLEHLSLAFTRVQDVWALSGLHSLKKLNLTGTPVSDLSALSGLTKLQTLILSHTHVSDVSALSGLTNLHTLNLSGTEVRDVSVLGSLSRLRALDLQYTAVTGVFELAHIRGLKIRRGGRRRKKKR